MVLVLVGIIAGTWLIYQDKDWQGFVAILSALGALIGSAVFGRKRREKGEQEDTADS